MADAPELQDAQIQPTTWEAAAKQNAMAAHSWLLKYEAAQDIADELAKALKQLVTEKVNYMDANNPWNPEEQHTIKQARAAIAKYNGGET